MDDFLVENYGSTGEPSSKDPRGKSEIIKNQKKRILDG